MTLYAVSAVCFSIHSSSVRVGADLYGFEHALSVVIRSQVFGDVKTDRADGGDEMQHHWNNLNNKQTAFI